jgi:NADH-quinone oxidoreductase subunit K
MFSLQINFDFILLLIGLFGIVLNRKSIIHIIMCVELVLLSLNLNFIVFSVYLDDLYGQIFALFVLTVAAAESAIGLALLIIYYRVRGSISMNQVPALKG